MRLLLPILAVLAASLPNGGCSGLGEGLGDLRSAVNADNFSRGDTYGTQRRVDVYGGSTAPSLPTIGASGYGK